MVKMDGNRDTGLDEDFNGPARVGVELRRVREQLGWTLADIAARLKIRLGFLEAIEHGDLAALPAPAYAAGFIRSYAEALGLDPDEILRRFRAEGMSGTKAPVLAFPEAAPDRGVPPGAIALLVAVIAVGGYVIWYGRSEREMRVANVVPPVPAKLAPLAVPKPSAPKAVAVKPASQPEPVALPVAPPAAPAGTTAAPVPQPAKETKSTITAIPLPPPPLPVKPAPQPASPPPSPQPDNLVIIAISRSWVQIRNIDGKILFSRVMQPGESWQLPDEPGLTLTTGNAGGAEMIRNGVPGPPLGPPGSVVHNALITPSGTIVPPPSPAPVRHVFRPRHIRRYHHPINPFAVSTRGEQ